MAPIALAKPESLVTTASMMPVSVASSHPPGTNVAGPWTNTVPISYQAQYHVVGPDHTNLVWATPDELCWDLLRSTNGGRSWYVYRTNYDDSVPIREGGIYKVSGHWQRN
jgi:hypothetical protein